MLKAAAHFMLGVKMSHACVCFAHYAFSTETHTVQICLQSPKDRTITNCLADAQELLQQSKGHLNASKLFLQQSKKSHSKLASYIGPVKLSSLSGVVLPPWKQLSTGYSLRNMCTSASCAAIVCPQHNKTCRQLP